MLSQQLALGLFESIDVGFELISHVVEGGGTLAQLVAALETHALPKLAIGDARRDRGHPLR